MNDQLRLPKKESIKIILTQHESLPDDDSILKTEDEIEREQLLKRFERELDELVGLAQIKQFVHELYAWIYINEKREEHGLKANKQVLHMIFKGNPGTGKTTVARLVASFLYEMNILTKGHLVEVERADLVGEYIGHTAQKTRKLLKKADGGILFIDEAYSLARGGEKDFGKEAIDTIVAALDNNQHNFVLILAGYAEEMNYFLSMNPGLPSRFPITIEFPNYTTEQLLEMVRRMLNKREYEWCRDSELYLKEHLKQLLDLNKRTFSNGRYIRNIVEEAIRRQAVRLVREKRFDKQSLITLTKDDFHLPSSKVRL